MMTADEEEEVTFDQSTLLTNRLKPHSRQKWCLKLFKTAGVSLAFLALGLCIAIPGPTLLDLMERVSTDTQHIAYIFTARSGGYLLGSILGGFLFDRFDQQLLLCMILFFTAIATAAAPWCQTLLVLAVMISFQGISMGFLDTGGNIYCIQIWGKNSGPYMQTLHFCFGVGAFIAPLLAKPFLSAESLHSGLNSSRLAEPSLLHVQGGNIPLVMPEYAQEGARQADRDPRDLPAELRRAIYRRQLEENETDITEQTVPTTARVTTTLKPTTPQKAVPRKPMTNDDPLDENTAADDPTKHKPEAEVELDRVPNSPKLSTASVRLPTNQTDGLRDTNTTSTQSQNDTIATPSTANLTTPTPTTSSTSAMSPTTTPAMPPITTPAASPTTTPKPTSSPVPSLAPVLTPSGPPTSSSPPQPVTTTIHPSTPPTQGPDANSNSTPALSNSTSSTVRPHKPSITVGEIVQHTLDALKHMSTIQFAYVIIAAILLLSSLLFMALYCWEKRESVLTTLGQDEDRGEITESRGFRFQMLTLLFLFYFLYVGMEVTYGGFIMTFAVQAMDWSKDRGTVVTAIFWGAMAAGRGIAIFVAQCCRPSVMLIIDLVLTLIAALILSFGVSHYHALLWPGTLLFGLGLSAIFPTGLSWAERYMKLTGKATAVMVVGSALGEMCVPAMAGYFFQRIDLMSLMYIMLALSTVACVLFVIMQNLASNRGDRYSVSKFLQLDEGESMEMVNQGEDVEIFNMDHDKPGKRKRVKFNLDSNGTSYKPLRSSEEE